MSRAAGAGQEKNKICATEANVSLLPEQYNVSAFRPLDPKTEGSITRDLAITIKGLDETAWAEGSFEFQVKGGPDTRGEKAR